MSPVEDLGGEKAWGQEVKGGRIGLGCRRKGKPLFAGDLLPDCMAQLNV